MDAQIAERIELRIRRKLYDYMVSEFGSLGTAVKQLSLPSSKTYRHLDPNDKSGTKKIPLTDVMVIAGALHGYAPSRFPTFGGLWDEIVADEL
jgi:hypothetical protein